MSSQFPPGFVWSEEEQRPVSTRASDPTPQEETMRDLEAPEGADVRGDELTYSVYASLRHAHAGSIYYDRDKAIAAAQEYRDGGWKASITIYGMVEGFEVWRTIEAMPPADIDTVSVDSASGEVQA